MPSCVRHSSVFVFYGEADIRCAFGDVKFGFAYAAFKGSGIDAFCGFRTVQRRNCKIFLLEKQPISNVTAQNIVINGFIEIRLRFPEIRCHA